MKRIILIALLIIPLSMVLNAQIKFGIKAGITSTSIKVDDIIAIDDASDIEELAIEGLGSRIGLQGGVFSRITIAKLFIQPELLFTSTSGEIEITELLEDGSIENKIKDQEFKQIDIPIMIGYKVGPLRLQAGPIASIVIDSQSALLDYDNYEEEFNGATWGYQVGIGLDIKKITIDIKYEGNLSKLGDGVTIGGETQEFDSRNSQFVFTLGFFF